MTPEERAFLAKQAEGEYQVFNPSVTLESLAGYAPAVPSSSSRLAHAATVIRQARILGGGEPYTEDNVPAPEDVNARFRWGHGVFFPSDHARESSLKNVSSQLATKLKAQIRKKGGAAPEVSEAILQDALRGVYNGPQYATPGDATSSVNNYTHRDNSWTADGERMAHSKIQSLLPPDQRDANAPVYEHPKSIVDTRVPGRTESRDMLLYK